VLASMQSLVTNSAPQTGQLGAPALGPQESVAPKTEPVQSGRSSPSAELVNPSGVTRVRSGLLRFASSRCQTHTGLPPPR
jgi:hypothetical protein